MCGFLFDPSDWLEPPDADCDFLDDELGRDACCRDELGREACCRGELWRDADCREDEFGFAADCLDCELGFAADCLDDCRDAEPDRSFGCDGRAVVTRGCWATRMDVSRTSRCSEGFSVVLRDCESREGATVDRVVRVDVTLPDDERLRNSIGSRSERHVDDPSTLCDVVLRATCVERLLV